MVARLRMRTGQRAAAGAWRTLAVILAAYVLSFMDRQMLNLLVEPIKRALRLSDIQVSLLQGFAFAVALSLVALPAGRLVDTRRRTFILGGGVAIWSLMTAACGGASGFFPLLLARAGVASGEAVMTPTALSIIGDSFPRRRLGLATSLYALGVHLGSGLALIAGGSLLTLASFTGPEGWRLVFVAMGLAGLPMTLVVLLLKEPLRGGCGLAEAPPTPWREALRFLRSQAGAQVCANLSAGFALMASYGVSAWAPAFFGRRFGWSPSAFGAAYGPLTIVSGVAGVLLAGLVGDWWRGRGVIDARLRLMGLAALAAAPLAATAPLVSAPALSLTLFAGAGFFNAAAAGCGPAVLQELAPPRLRGVTHALALLSVNLIALGLGPTSLALLTDYGLHDERKLGVSLSLVPAVVLLLAATFSLLGRDPFRRSISALHQDVTFSG